VNRPRGFLASPNSAQADGVRPFGTFQFVASGAAGAFLASNPQDKLIDLVQALRPPYRQGAVFVMNSSTAAKIRKFKTADGAFLWQPGLVAGQPDTLLGYPVVEAEDMPDTAADSLSIAFGNFKAGYLIAERAEDPPSPRVLNSTERKDLELAKRLQGCRCPSSYRGRRRRKFITTKR
jgi:HK97 family phage major capsid protein